jgi:glycosyltransferase involved in cell wall biosynthesis
MKSYNFVFYFPYSGIGGVSVLFLKIAKALKKLDLNVFLVDYQDGFMFLNKGEIPCIIYSHDNDVIIPDNSIIILQSLTPWRFPKNFKGNNLKCFFWNLHPFNMIPHFPFFNKMIKGNKILGRLLLTRLFYFFTKDTISLIKHLIKHSAIIFMDRSNTLIYSSHLNINIVNPILFPVLINSKKFEPTFDKKIISNFNINVCWLGRIVDFKYFILCKAISDLSILELDLYKIKFTIIGDGDKLLDLKCFCKSFNKISFNFIDNLEGKCLDDELLKQNILFAMGTSALDGANLGIPTVCLDYSYKEVENLYFYNWIFDVQNYDLANNIDDLMSNNRYSMKKIIEQLLQEGNFLSKKSYNYCVSNHIISKNILNFIKIVNKNNIDYHKLNAKPFLKKSKIYTLYNKLRN